MFKRTLNHFCLAFVCLGLGGCTIAKLSGRGASPLLMNQPAAKVEVVQKINASKQLIFDYTGAVDVSEVLSQVSVPGKVDAIINVTITLKTTVGDFFLNLITLGIANARTFEVNGDAVRAPNGLGELSIPGSEVVSEAQTIHQLQVPVSSSDLTSEGASMIVKTKKGFALVRYNAGAVEVIN